MPNPTQAPPVDPTRQGAVRVVRTALGPTVLLDRPGRRNALTLQMWRGLGEVVRGLEEDAGPVYVTGAGGYFCSGADLEALRWARTDEAHAREFVHGVVGCLLSLHTAGREVVAVVEGGAAGGGVEIMAACDRRVAIGSPSLVFPFGEHGMELDGFTRWRLHQLVGDEQAERLVDGRHVVDAEEALRLGLVDEQHESLEAFAAAERGRGAKPVDGRSESYLTGTEDIGAAVARAAEPMLRAFPPYRHQP